MRPTIHSIALTSALAFTVGLVAASAAWSQATGGSPTASLGVVPGARVRLVSAQYGDVPQIGTVAAVRGDSMVFRRERQSDSATIGFAHLARLDVSRGKHARTLTGLGIGFAGGALAGAIGALATYHKSSCGGGTGFGCGVGDIGAGGSAAGGALVGGAAGALIGLIAGSFIHTERWRTVPLNSLDHAQTGVNLISSPMGPGLAVRVAGRF